MAFAIRLFSSLSYRAITYKLLYNMSESTIRVFYKKSKKNYLFLFLYKDKRICTLLCSMYTIENTVVTWAVNVGLQLNERDANFDLFRVWKNKRACAIQSLTAYVNHLPEIHCVISSSTLVTRTFIYTETMIMQSNLNLQVNFTWNWFHYQNML